MTFIPPRSKRNVDVEETSDENWMFSAAATRRAFATYITSGKTPIKGKTKMNDHRSCPYKPASNQPTNKAQAQKKGEQPQILKTFER